ncbi:MAG: twin-arginine translocase TatA/TatE family subunit [Thermodesulfobacteria bacterium]|nr:twin-arginine translocase TatA/TatE family subunit [Thermodesulfobacteriota bacterium]
MFGLGTQELLVILVIALFLFGGKKLPEIGAGLGKGLRAFKKGLSEVEDELKDEAPEAKREKLEDTSKEKTVTP